ncbi:conserved hypothetical protein [Hyella patelloides LEGE 07179]|uniref:DUF4132 domain-containing protein n=1 Tax=Hyella patelloides LEGE 07179 TaxID=945734 RepID=A0A563W297_9CYAN|nr:DUF4132 domain-containing protein [Hyella patelloides]VEP17663.1 conserved hypothetical protein [Hyella patelloides LEGE 07179]
MAIEGGKLAKAAVDILRDLKLKGHEELIIAWLGEQPEEEAEKLKKEIFDYAGKAEVAAIQFNELTTPQWLKEGINSLGRTKKIKPPEWLNIIDLPSIYIDNIGLNQEQILAVLLAIKKSKQDSIHPLLIELKKYAMPESLDNFTVQLFELWRKEDAPSKDKWAMFALGYLGSEIAAIKLAPLIITWRSELKHQRVTWGLDCLKTMGTDTALMQLNGIAQKTRHKNLRKKALEQLAITAKERNLTTEELEDRIVPTCGLDEQGKRIFDFGVRQFEFVLGEGMKPQVKDDKDKIRANLPKPGKKDDPDKANNAISAWKILKKQITQVTKIQATRLEQAMITQRRWNVDEFELRIVNHPLMTHLAWGLVWGGYDVKGNRVTTFRIAEDRTSRNIENETLQLKDITTVGIVHAIALTPEEKAKWNQIWLDYELFSPFPQLNRELFLPTPEERETTLVTRFKDITIPGIRLVSIFEKQEWIRGGTGDGGGCNEHSKTYPNAGLIVSIKYTGGIAMWDVRDSSDIEITRCHFAPLETQQKALSLKDVDAIIFSEVMRDLTRLTGNQN